VDLSVVIATRHRPDVLAETLASFEALDTAALAWEILVVDNSEGDARARGVVDGLAARLPLRLLLEPGRGVNRARNRALDHIRGAIVVFTDDDVVPRPDWLVELRRGIQRWPGAQVFGGRVLASWPAENPEPARHGLFEHAYAVADWDLAEGPYSAHQVFGPNMAYRARVFADGRRFDPRFGPDGTDAYITGSETSLNLQLERAGMAPVYLPRAVVSHRIRREQLEPAWLYRRAFRLGRWEAHLAGLSRRPWRALPGLLLDLRRASVRFRAARAGGDPEAALAAGLVYWQRRGALFQWRRGV
jgi:glycosyltransferase involved in cell wall biosynthesis